MLHVWVDFKCTHKPSSVDPRNLKVDIDVNRHSTFVFGDKKDVETEDMSIDITAWFKQKRIIASHLLQHKNVSFKKENRQRNEKKKLDFEIVKRDDADHGSHSPKKRNNTAYTLESHTETYRCVLERFNDIVMELERVYDENVDLKTTIRKMKEENTNE